jgi:hypothetical protein
MGHYILGLGANGANGVAEVAVVEQDIRIGLETLEVFGRACRSAVKVFAIADSEVLVAGSHNSAEGDSCNDCGG